MNRHVLVSKTRSRNVVKYPNEAKTYFGCVLQQWMEPTIVFMTFNKKALWFQRMMLIVAKSSQKHNLHKWWNNIFFGWIYETRCFNLMLLLFKITLYICASKAFQTAWHFWQNYSLLSRSFASRSSKSCKWRGSRWKTIKLWKLCNKEQIDLFMPDCEERIDH